MGELGDILAQDSGTVQAIYAYHKARGDAEPQRGYLGASIIGEPCARRLWYTFRGLAREDIEGRVYRLFETGDLAEPRFVGELRAIGCEVHDVDPKTGEQFEVLALGGHFSGHMDAALRGLPEAPKAWHVGEFKTHNEKSFHKLKAQGVMESKPLHYAQMQAYMGNTGMKRALYLACDKNTDELYSERIEFDPQFFKTLMDKARMVIESPQPCERAYNRPDAWGCKFCPAHTLCWGGGEVALPIPEKTCRSCCHATPLVDRVGAAWRCELFEQDIDTSLSAKDCNEHLVIPGLLVGVDPVDSGSNFIDFADPRDPHGDTHFRHGSNPAWFSTVDLMNEPMPRGKKLPRALEAEPESLIQAYPWSDSHRMWDGPAEELPQALAEHVGLPPELLGKIEPNRTQVDDEVGAAEYLLAGEHYLVVLYKREKQAAIWKGKS